jgi:FAD/FMN-containing dehydrogenase
VHANPDHAALAADLARIVGADHVLADPALRAGYETDWTGRHRGRAVLVVRPGTPTEVGATLRACASHGVGVVPQGGNTGLVAGATPAGEVVLSTTRLADLGPVDELAATVTVGAGATLAAVQAHTAPSGLTPAVDLAARGSATIGGMVATDAGGMHVVRHGSMRRQILGIEAVLADGTCVGRVDGPARDSAGIHLPSILAGSEGTLAVVTRVRLRLVPAWRFRATALVAFDGIDAAVAATAILRRRLSDLDAIELVDHAGLALVEAHGRLAAPFGDRYPAALLVETAADRSTVDDLAETLDGIAGARDALLADDGSGRRRLWAFREGVTDAIAAAGVPHKLDVGLPLARLGAFVGALGPLIAAIDPAARLFVFGHLAEGNLHVNVLGPAPDDERVDDAVLELVLEHGGAISAEHGIGRAKARWLRRARSAGELAIQDAIKHALDPGGLLNPGVLDPAGQHGEGIERPGPDGH